MRLGLDIYGGDFAPECTILGAIEARKEISEEIDIVLFGDRKSIMKRVEAEGVDPYLFNYIHTTASIEMADHPAKAFKSKPNSSISLGFSLLKKGEIDVFASAGNSGAMLVGAMLTVRATEGVIRPSITSGIPRPDGKMTIVLDVGINVDCKPDVLYQFGILGSVYARRVYGVEAPKVGLLNIGEEEKKGNITVQAAYSLMKESTDFNFIGNVEGRDLFSSDVDVIVCDGFTGNVVLKEAEAFYSLIKKQGIENEFFDRFNYEKYGGTPILGVNGNVIIGHGISSPLAIKNMLKLSLEVAQAKLSENIKIAFQ
ncbi:MAG: phosphate acyltransferase PlsX [Flavobacteriales bacterium]|nr:phosphate acyltransferase PlsX [Flavobacteriales bacterium]